MKFLKIIKEQLVNPINESLNTNSYSKINSSLKKTGPNTPKSQQKATVKSKIKALISSHSILINPSCNSFFKEERRSFS